MNEGVSSKVMCLVMANKTELADMLENAKIPWSVNNFVALEQVQKKILAEELLEKRVEQLLHLARLRGGISDLVEIMAFEESDEY